NRPRGTEGWTMSPAGDRKTATGGDGDGGTATDAHAEHAVVSLEDVEVHFENRRGILDLFGESEHVRAVDGVSLDVHENDVVAVIGESGCGKTTLGKAAIGLQRPTGGSVKYRGQDIWDAKDGTGDVAVPYGEIRRSLQIIHQDPGSSLNPNQTVLTTLRQPLDRWRSGLSRDEKEATILGMLEEVGLTPASDYAYRYPHQLSGGEKQRIALVRSLLMEPDLILADEAVSALDVSLRVDMMDLMLELQERFDTSFLFISHNLSNARYFAGRADGRIAIMYLGHVVEVGPYDEVLANPQHPYTKVLKWATPELEVKHGEITEPPVREIDIPDPVDPPSGCRFHTRCPEAREYCVGERPELLDVGDEHGAACYRVDDAHPYWESDPLPGVAAASEGSDGDAGAAAPDGGGEPDV
ncbi:MAG: ABC transporter ATP-binding protein, partial [Haloarculaceae archaeon]